MIEVLQGKVDCAPKDAGYDGTRLDAVNAFFSRMIEQKVIYGAAYRLARRGRTFAAAALGSRHYKKPDVPMLPDSVFTIASQTKAFTAVAVQILVEDGLLSIEDKVAKYLPQFDGAPYDAITLFHLLTHTSGLYPDDGCIPDKHHVKCFGHIESQFEKDGKNTDWIAAGLRPGMRCPPGTEWAYCSFGIMALGAVIEKASGIKVEKFIEERICKPLGMTETAFNPTADMAKRAVIFNEWAETRTAAKQVPSAGEGGLWDLIPGNAGALISTTEDMIRFGIMLQQGGRLGGARILGRKAVESMTTQYLYGVPDFCWGASTKERRYGLGLDMRRFTGSLTSPGTYFHEGSGHSVLIVDPAEEMVCSCVYPFVDDVWNGDCNNRLYNVMWSGIL